MKTHVEFAVGGLEGRGAPRRARGVLGVPCSGLLRERLEVELRAQWPLHRQYRQQRGRGQGARARGASATATPANAAEVARRLTAQPGSHTHLESVHSPASWQSRAVVQVPPPTGRSAAPQCGKVATIRKRDTMAPGTLAAGSASCYLRLAQPQVSRGPPPPAAATPQPAALTAHSMQPPGDRRAGSDCGGQRTAKTEPMKFTQKHRLSHTN